MPSHQIRVQQANCSHTMAEGRMSLERGHGAYCPDCHKWWTDEDWLRKVSGYRNALVSQLRLRDPDGTVRTVDVIREPPTQPSLNDELLDAGYQGLVKGALEGLPVHTELPVAAPPSMEDKQLGISIWFVKEYDVEADKRPPDMTCWRVPEFGGRCGNCPGCRAWLLGAGYPMDYPKALAMDTAKRMTPCEIEGAHTWTMTIDADPARGTPCDCGQKQWGV